MGYSGRLAIVMTALALPATGAIGALAWQHGLWGTVLSASMVALSLVLSLSWTTARQRHRTPSSIAADEHDGERIMLRALLDQAPGALLAVEGGTRIRVLNRAARRLFATDDLVSPAPAALLASDATRWRHEGRSWRIDRVDVAGLGPPRTVIALVNVEAEEHAAEARATRELLRVLGHEVMNAMAPITSLAESAMAVLAVPERRDVLLPDILGTLARRADGLRRFTEAYRLVARLPEPVLAPVRIDELLVDMARLFEAQWHRRVTLIVADVDPVTVALDRAQMTQALWALLQNGAEAALTAAPPPMVWLSTTSGENHIAFRVADSGPGVEPGDVTRMFHPFVTTKPDGNGIGLTAARQIAQSHGGDVVHIPNSLVTAFEIILPC